jgi:hypothetical protein
MMSLATFIQALYLSHQMFSLVTGEIPNLRTESDWICTPDHIKLAIEEHLYCCGFNSSDTIMHPLERRCKLPSSSTLLNNSVTTLHPRPCVNRIRFYDEFPKDLITNYIFVAVATLSALYYVVLVVNSFDLAFQNEPQNFQGLLRLDSEFKSGNMGSSRSLISYIRYVLYNVTAISPPFWVYAYIPQMLIFSLLMRII